MKRPILIATFFLCLGIAGAQYYNVPGFPSMSGGAGLFLVDSKLTIRDGRREVVITSGQLIDLLSERFPVTTYPEIKEVKVVSGTSSVLSDNNIVCLNYDASWTACK